jgi:hypothetical protein
MTCYRYIGDVERVSFCGMRDNSSTDDVCSSTGPFCGWCPGKIDGECPSDYDKPLRGFEDLFREE